MTTPPEPASMAVLLREAARMLLQWAAVFDATVQVPRPSPIPTSSTSGVPSTTDGDPFPGTHDEKMTAMDQRRQEVLQNVRSEVPASQADWVRHELSLHRLDDGVYASLLTYLVQFSPSKVYRARDGRLMISKYAVLTDAEITEALR